MAQSWFSDIEAAPAIEVFALTAAFNEDLHPQKVSLGVGAYRTDDSKPWVLPVVHSVEERMAQDTTLNHEYLPVEGLKDFCQAGIQLVLGSDNPAIVQNRADGIQALGGTGALRIGLDFVRNNLGISRGYVSSPTWGNHKGILKSLGYSVHEYRYWDDKKRGIDLAGMLEDLRTAPERSCIILHAVAHNPTGMDPTAKEWEQIAEVIKERHHFPFLDCAYQGFASGDLDKDASTVRFFAKQGFEFFCAQSFSKNFGLYNERVGNLLYVLNSSEKMPHVKSQLKLIVRQTWSNPPNHGCRIVATVLNNPALFAEWKGNCKTMADRILLMRKQLYDQLRSLGTPGTWDHIVKQTGMFSYTGLSVRQVEHVRNRFHIYMLKSGRINMCGLNSKNIDYVANAIHDAVTNIVDDPKL